MSINDNIDIFKKYLNNLKKFHLSIKFNGILF